MAKNELPVEAIEKLAEILKAQDLTEIEVETDAGLIKVRKETAAVTAVAAPAASSPAAAPVASEAPAAIATPSDVFEVKSPMVGTFYAKPSPDADTFVSLGSKVNKGDTLCIVEAMKLMNDLPADVSGEVIEICVEDAQAISFGEVIMKIKKA